MSSFFGNSDVESIELARVMDKIETGQAVSSLKEKIY